MNRAVVLLGTFEMVVDNFVLLCVLDGWNEFLREYFQHVLCIVDDALTSPHENQRVASLDLFFILY